MSNKIQLRAFSDTTIDWSLYMTIGNILGYKWFKWSNQCVRLITWLSAKINKPSKSKFIDSKEMT